MPYLELSFDLSEQAPDAAEAACFQTGALAVTFSDASDDPVLEPKPGEMRLWRRTRMQALFDARMADPSLIIALAEAVGIAPERLSARAIADRVWEREWLQDFHPMLFGRRLWISPRHETVAASDAVVVRLDPGLAFGTGTHQTTAMCLEWLDSTDLRQLDVVDYGCGSGVLAIAALKLGAKRAFAYDIDPQALLATGENASDNHVADRLILCTSAQRIPTGCDVVLANILAQILILERHRLAPHLKTGGHWLLSGILASQEAEVVSAYRQCCDMTRYAMRDEWVALSGRQR